jgi:hypothetical protein
MPACMLKQELLEQIHRVSKEKAELQKLELKSVLSGSQDSAMELRIDNAREMRRVLMDRLRSHIAEHGC